MSPEPSPVPVSSEAWTERLEHFSDRCAICHANNDSGDTPIRKDDFPRVPDLHMNDIQSRSDGELFFAIYNGIRLTAMPAWGEGDMEKDIGSWKLVHFIQHLTSSTADVS